MPLKDELDKLQAQFDSVARAMAQEIPEVWESALRTYKGNHLQAVEFLIGYNMFIGGKAAERALEGEEGKQAVLLYLSRLESDVYL